MKYLIFICFTATSLLVEGQEYNTHLAQDITRMGQVGLGHVNTVNLTEANAAQFELFNDDWERGSLVTKDGQTILLDSLHYSIAQDKILFSRDNKVLVLDKNIVKTIVIGTKAFGLFLDEKKKGELEPKYFEILASGKMYLLRNHYLKKVTSSTDNPLGVKTDVHIQTVIRSKYMYYTNRFLEPKELPRSKSKVLAIFKSNNKMVKYAKSNKLSIKREKDLKKLFQHYNS